MHDGGQLGGLVGGSVGGLPANPAPNKGEGADWVGASRGEGLWEAGWLTPPLIRGWGDDQRPNQLCGWAKKVWGRGVIGDSIGPVGHCNANHSHQSFCLSGHLSFIH